MNAVSENMYSVRNMREEDLPKVLEIEYEAHTFPWSLGIFKDCIRVGYLCPMIVSDEVIQAYGVMSIAAGEAHIFNVCVAQDFRRQGLGRGLMHLMIDMAKKKQVNSIFLEVRSSNFAATNLYDSMGFIEVGHRKDYYPSHSGREDAIIMAMDVS